MLAEGVVVVEGPGREGGRARLEAREWGEGAMCGRRLVGSGGEGWDGRGLSYWFSSVLRFWPFLFFFEVGIFGMCAFFRLANCRVIIQNL